MSSRRGPLLASSFDRVTSLKVRLGIIILAGIGSAVAVVTLGRSFGIGWLAAAALGTVVALLLVRSLAHGATSRIRDLAAAAEALARGDHEHRVEVRGRDEVSHLATAFNDMADQLTGLDRMRRSFVADASHELRTPIAAARAVLENMVDGVEQATPDRLALVLGQVERLGRLVEQLLDLSRLESGQVAMVQQVVDLRGVVRDAITEAELADERSVDMIRVHTESGPALVHGDAERLRQVVSNLVGNAVRHAPGGSIVDVDLCVRRPVVELRVSDVGPGIPEVERQRVFERFSRGDAARSSASGGAGLGLAIVSSIVEQHGGTVRVTATDDRAPAGRQGCRMIVALPSAETCDSGTR